MRRAAAALLGAMLIVQSVAWAGTSDLYFSSQWGLEVIEAETAWTASRGRGVVVAVIDTGVQADHEDLAGRVLPGRDFVDDDDDARDENGHGTLIAGIIAALTDNGKGVASVAPRARVLPVRVLDERGEGISSDVADGIRWAVARGADVINLSLAQDDGGGGGGGLIGSDLLRDPSVGEAIEDAAEAGATVVVAAGNDRNGGRPETAYDATVPGVVVVGASTRDDRLAAYSNHGAGIDLLAPGGGSATDPRERGCNQSNSIVSTWWNPKEPTKRNRYGGGCGTSMAVAFVSGAAALLHAQGKTNRQAVRRMLDTAVDLGPDGRDDRHGHGRLAAAAALGARPKPAASPPAPRGTRSALPPKDNVVVQGSSEPLATPSERSTVRAPTPTEPPNPPTVAFPSAPAPEPKGWPVTLASALVSVLVLAHTLRFVGRAPRT